MRGPNPQKGAVVSIDRQRRAIQDLIIGDKSMRQIARETGVSEWTIRQWRKRGEVQDAIESRSDANALPSPSPTREDPAPPKYQPTGEGAVYDALALSPRASEADWAELGRAYPPPGMAPERSAVIFRAIARGNPLLIAANRAGFGDEEPELWRSRAKEDPRWLAWHTAIGMAQGAAIDRLGQRVQEGMSGWQGAARQLIALRPDVYNIKDLATSVGASSLDQLDADSLLAVVETQLQRARGESRPSRPTDETLPLSETGMDDDGEGAS